MLLSVHRDRTTSELRNCLKVEVAVLGSTSLIVRTVSVDVKQHGTVRKGLAGPDQCINMDLSLIHISEPTRLA